MYKGLMARLILEESLDDAMRRIGQRDGAHELKEYLRLMEIEIKKRDKWWGKRTKSRPGWSFYHNKPGHLWEVFWHYEPYYAKWKCGWLVLLRGMFTNKLRGFQIWWPPVRWKLIWSRDGSHKDRAAAARPPKPEAPTHQGRPAA